MLNANELKIIVKKIRTNWIKNKNYLAVLQCTTSYPVIDQDVNLAVIQDFKKKFNNELIGYSDHTIGVDAAIFAAAFGANIVEKHFTIKKNFSTFRDHQLSADENEMKTLVEKIRKIEVLRGIPEKKILKTEKKFIKIARRSYCINKNKLKGSRISKDDLILLRPGSGITKKKEVLNKILKKNIKSGEILNKEFI